MVKKFPIHPSNPERICWGCDKYCAADSLACGAEQTPHLVELFGEDWMDWRPGFVPVDLDAPGEPQGGSVAAHDGAHPITAAAVPTEEVC